MNSAENTMKNIVGQLVQAGIDAGMTFEDAEYKSALFLISQLHGAGLDMELAIDALLGKGRYAAIFVAVAA